LRAHPDVEDALLALSLLPTMLITLLIDEEDGVDYRGPDLIAVAIVIGLAVCVAFRRRATVAVAFVGAALTALMWVRLYVDGSTAFAGAILVYSVGRHLPRPTSVRVVLAVGLPLSALAIGLAFSVESHEVWQALGRTALIGGAFFFGDAVRSRAETLQALHERAERAESEREARAEQAVAEERTRIARDVHDVVAHALSVMVIQSNAAQRLVGVDPVAAGDAMREVTDTGRATLAEMRRIVGTLAAHDETADYRPQPQLADITELVERVRAGGCDVRLSQDDDLPAVSPGRQLAAYRIVQESLTNVLKHAGQALVTVDIDHVDGELHVAVRDDGRGASATSDGRGRGLLGMRERVDAVGGSLDAGPRVGGGFAVHARIPLDVAAIDERAPA
jgi:signal transduction histidine kinase